MQYRVYRSSCCSMPFSIQLSHYISMYYTVPQYKHTGWSDNTPSNPQMVKPIIYAGKITTHKYTLRDIL